MNIHDQQARIEALHPAQSFIVQAPAGSGKTELLTQRILSLLANAVHQPEEVLAITFTRKAAEEMRLRVMESLQLGTQSIQPETEHKKSTWTLARKVLLKNETMGWNLLLNPQRLQIMTIDAFCASIAKQMPVLSRMGALPKVSNQPYVLYQKSAEKTISYLLEQDDDNIETLLLHLDNRQDRVKNEIANMLQYREQWLGLIINQDHDNLREFLENTIRGMIHQNLQDVSDTFPYELWHDLKTLIRSAVNHIDSPELENILRWDGCETHPEALPEWKALVEWILTREGTVRKRVDKNMGFPGDKEKMKEWLFRLSEQPLLVEYLQHIRVLPQPYYTENQWQVLQSLFKILPIASAQLLLEFQQQRCIDFSEVAQSALFALKSQDDPSDLLLKLDNQINHILVDEFQDTSILQFQLLEKLVSGWEENDGRTLFLVGDPMQSIYRFRQAQVGLFLRAQQEGIGSIKLINLSLQMNFRSRAGLIHWFNQHAPRCFSENSDMTLGAITYSPSKALEQHDNTRCVHAYASKDSKQQALQLIDTLKVLESNQDIQSIAILVRARNHLVEITAALAQEGIPYQAIELESLHQRPVIQHLLALTRAFISLNDTIAWLAVLRGPFCGLSLEDITLLRESKKDKTVYQNIMNHNNNLSADGINILNRISPVFRHYMLEKHRMSLSNTLKSLWIALGGPAYLSDEQTLHDAQAFFDLLASCEQGGTLEDESAFMQQLEKTFSQPINGSSKIQVMTIHRAKGLEFDAVFIPGLERRTSASDKPLLLWDDLLFAPIHATQNQDEPIYDYLWHIQKRKGHYELGRLLYVALTRARNQLHLFACIDDEKSEPTKGSFLSLLWTGLESEFVSNINETPYVTSDQSKPLMRLDPNWKWPHDFPALQLLSEIDTTKGNHVSMDMCSSKRLREKALGTVLHSALHHQHGNETMWRMHLLELGIHDDIDEAVGIIKQGFQKSKSDKRGQWILNQTEENSEYAILARHKDEFASIIIDKTFVDEQGVRWIIDYKTSQPGDMPLEQFYERAHEQHAEQLERYAAILAQQEERPIKLGLYFPLFSGWYEWEFCERNAV